MNNRETKSGVRYVTEPHVVLMCRPSVRTAHGLEAMAEEHVEFEKALNDFHQTDSDGPEEYLQFAGQLCYMALGEKRTSFADNAKYLANIMDQAHGSVLEHLNYGFLVLGVDRATTHELVRHRSGMAYSQVSQRYVDSEYLRFVCPVEDQSSEEALADFEGTMLFVSHDRQFLGALSNRVLELTGTGLRTYGGGYTEYVSETGHEAPGLP